MFMSSVSLTKRASRKRRETLSILEAKECNEASAHYCRLLVVALFLFEPLMNTFVLVTRRFIALPFHLDTVICYACLLYVLFRALPHIVKSFSWDEIAPFLVVLAYGFMRFIIDDQGAAPSYYGEILATFLAGAVPSYILFRVSGRDAKLAHYLRVAAIVGVVVQVLRVFILSSYTETSYSQYLGYQTLPFFLLCVSALFSSRDKARQLLYAGLSIVSLYTIMCAGARGPIAAALGFFVVRFALFNGGSSLKKIALSAGVAVAAMFLLINLDQVVSTVVSFVSMGGGSSRLEAKLGWGTLFSGGGRDDISAFCLQRISEAPLFGYGIGQDRVLINAYMHGDNTIGYYPHNIILELAMHYGIFVAAFVIVLGCYGLIRSYIKADREIRDLILVLVFAGLVPLFFSSTYLDSPFLFALFGLCLSVLRPNTNKSKWERN